VTPPPAAPDPRVQRGLAAQLEAWRALLAEGERRVGWKIGLNSALAQEQLGIADTVIGHLTSGTLLEGHSRHSLEGGKNVGAEPEVAIHLGSDVAAAPDRDQAAAAIAGLGAAIEVVDLDPAVTDLERILAGNVFHRAVLLGEPSAGTDVRDMAARLLRNGSVAESVDDVAAAVDPVGVVAHVANLLASRDEMLRAGDVIISGSLTPIVWVKSGDRVELDLGRLGGLELAFG
jgi:2-keto-4-pentenoate hydratase